VFKKEGGYICEKCKDKEVQDQVSMYVDLGEGTDKKYNIWLFIENLL